MAAPWRTSWNARRRSGGAQPRATALPTDAPEVLDAEARRTPHRTGDHRSHVTAAAVARGQISKRVRGGGTLVAEMQ